MYGHYNADAIGACFSRTHRFPSEPIDFWNYEEIEEAEEESTSIDVVHMKKVMEVFNANFYKRKAREEAENAKSAGSTEPENVGNNQPDAASQEPKEITREPLQ